MKSIPVHRDLSERIKLERLKRSWTQEHLADAAELSARTVQRLEGGAEASAETLRALAEAFGLSIEDFTSTGIRKHFNAPWDKKLKVVTTIVIGILIGVTFLVNGYIAIFPVVILICCLFLAVDGYSVKDGTLYIHRLGWSTKYPVSQLTEITVNPQAMVGSIRVFGIGGLFGYIGYFRNTLLGKYLAFATDTSKCLVLSFGEKRVVVTPDSPECMEQTLLAELKLKGSALGF